MQMTWSEHVLATHADHAESEVSTRGGYGVRPGREHDTTCAKAAAGLMVALERAAAEGMPTLIDLGHEGLAGSALRIPVKKVK
ncbi:hypothetical protein QFZ49_003241 [Streptomyces turgidiscabies]|uniref:Uncharacterized protein n=1 Tax=Streptomyces turgidiscabies TaxID=85558 RepID=A0ABU0RMV6_9ACTN|nr:hypothetical protein [Streptomyces turgidiscabies]MDQ0933301.1 hypothetical protein [Streptomyces turgidiscabies]